MCLLDYNQSMINHSRSAPDQRSSSSQDRIRVVSQSRWSWGGGEDGGGVGGGGDGVGGEGGTGGEIGAGDGGGGGVGGAVLSTLREEKVATFCLAMVVTLRLPEAGGGEDWSRRGRGGSSGTLVAASAREAWGAAARRLRRALAPAPRWRRRLTGAGVGSAGTGTEWSSSTSSFAFILPPLVVKVRDAPSPASLAW